MLRYETGHFRVLNEICIVAKILCQRRCNSLHESICRFRDLGLGAFNMTFQRFVVKGLLWD